MRGFIAIIDKFNHILFNFLAVLFGGIALLTIYQVFARYALNSPLVWSEEVVRTLMVWIVLLGTAIALRKGSLISVEIILHLVPKKVRRILDLIIITLNVVYMVLLTKYGFIIMDSLKGQTTGALEIPVSWAYAAIPVGAIMALINSLVVVIELFTKKEEGEHQDDSPIVH